MKQIIILMLFQLVYTSSSAQNIVNGNFLDNNGNDVYRDGCSYYPELEPTPHTFSDTSCPNWLVSHGISTFAVVNPYFVNSIYVSSIFSDRGSEANKHKGSGIMGGYNFMPNTTYEVKIRLNYADLRRGTLYLYAASGIARNLTVAGDHGCNSYIPSASGSQLIGSLAEIHFTPAPSSSDFTEYTFVVTIPVGSSFDKLWIYPKSFEDPEGTNLTGIIIQGVSIRRICDESKTFASGVIPGTIYQNHRYYYIGSSYGTSSSAVQIDPDASTQIRAGIAVMMKDKFIAAVNPGHTFVAEILRCDEPILTRVGPKEQEAGVVSGENLKVYPNPAKEFLKLELPASFSSKMPIEVSVYDMTGRLLLTEIVQAPHFQLATRDLQPGVYLLRVAADKSSVLHARFVKE